MNERIKELANIWANRRAEDEKLGITYTFSEKALETFAELIVRETLDQVAEFNRLTKAYQEQGIDPEIDVAKEVLKNFGVKE